jgi:elongation factor Ts
MTQTIGDTTVSFTAKDVMTLREKTGLGMMDCKKALKEQGGDMAAAEAWLRESRKDKMDTRTERATGEGRIGIACGDNAAVIVEIQTETDFTARTEAFMAMVDAVTDLALSKGDGDVSPCEGMTRMVDEVRMTTGENANFARGFRLSGGSFGQYIHHDGKRACLIQVDGDTDGDLLKGICQHIVFHDPAGISEDDISSEDIDRIRTEALAEASEAGKNDEIAEKIADGKVRKHLEENTLLHQKYVLDETQAIKDVLPDGVSITRFVRYTLGA